MCGYSRLDTIRNMVIREKVQVAPIEEKIKQTRLKLFGHVKRRSVNAPVTKTITLKHCRRGRG